MSFAPQRRTLFRHRNFQKWSENGVFSTFSLGNVFRATTACTFSTSQFPKVVRELVCFAHIDFEMCFAPQRRAIFHLSSGQLAPHPPLQRAYFSTLLGKTQCFATFLPFRAPASSFVWLFLFSDLLSAALLFSSLTLTTSTFHLPILSEVKFDF